MERARCRSRSGGFSHGRTNWSRGYKTYRNGVVVGFVVPLDRLAVREVSMPAVNYDAMYQALVRGAKGASNKIVYWSRLLDWKNQTLTPNPDAIYLMPFYDATHGPVVLEIPPADEGSITGSIDDGWQAALADVGPAGIDAGKGGKFLILPPDHQAPVPDGYLPMPSPTFCGYALLRSNLKSGSESNIAKAVDYGKRVKFYALADGDHEARTTFVDAADVMFDATIPYDDVLRCSRPPSPSRAVADPRQSHDRHAQGHRHRERQTLRARHRDLDRTD